MERGEIQAAIAEVARRHNLLLSQDDPLLVMLTLNEIVLARILAKQEQTLEAALDQISAGAAQQVEAAREVAGLVITGGADYVASELRLAIAALKEDLLAASQTGKAEAGQAAERARLAQRSAWQAAMVTIAILCVVLGAMISPVMTQFQSEPEQHPHASTTAKR
jgi:hypothetical protein